MKAEDFLIRSALRDSWFHYCALHRGITLNNQGGCCRWRAEGQIPSIPALTWDRDVRPAAEGAALKLNETAMLTGPNLVTLLTTSVAQRLGPAGVFMAARMTHCYRFLHIYAQGSWLPSARTESVHNRFLWARCDRHYRHIWQWYLHAGGMRLPQRRLSLLFYFGPLCDSGLHRGAALLFRLTTET